MPLSCLDKYRVNLLIGSKGECFYKDLNSKKLKVLSCLGEGKMILDRKRVFGRKCWLREITLKKRESLGLRLAKVE